MSHAEPPLYQRDPEAWKQHLAEGNARQARKRVGADALLTDSDGRILLVNPSYKPNWDIPGGMAEANEPPDTTVRRELEEELGLTLSAAHLPLLCVDWVSPHGPWDDSLMMIFDGGVLTATQLSNLRLVDGELDEFGFVDLQHAQQVLRPYVWRRLDAAVRARTTGATAYLRDGRPD
ncbi:NUDIX hydrolase [Nocardia sp. NBC_00508]|uniref:NUDIX hydrolase n=1 Tax=Nocardia sp. NBC_00508 TaxID=2975992 RepID=UPI002E8039B5|nr:NUDIX hydrolase [Nocardia sp. NBC_00508]WUD68683.1 NUDIX hydrolase [Nocardia sp. NBC_00508]